MRLKIMGYNNDEVLKEIPISSFTIDCYGNIKVDEQEGILDIINCLIQFEEIDWASEIRIERD